MFVWVKTQCCLAKKMSKHPILMQLHHNDHQTQHKCWNHCRNKTFSTTEKTLELLLFSCFFFSCHSGCLENSRFLESNRFPDTAIIFQTTIQFFQNQCKKTCSNNKQKLFSDKSNLGQLDLQCHLEPLHLSLYLEVLILVTLLHRHFDFDFGHFHWCSRKKKWAMRVLPQRRIHSEIEV